MLLSGAAERWRLGVGGGVYIFCFLSGLMLLNIEVE